MSDFYEYFKENMDGLGLAAPEALFSSLQVATGSIAAILGVIEKFGTRVTMFEVIRAGTKLEALSVIGACSAAYYAGAVIGSLAVATGRSMANGTSLADVIFVAKQYDLNRPWLVSQLQREPKMHGQTSQPLVRAIKK